MHQLSGDRISKVLERPQFVKRLQGPMLCRQFKTFYSLVNG